jgi:hypothetical protein
MLRTREKRLSKRWNICLNSRRLLIKPSLMPSLKRKLLLLRLNKSKSLLTSPASLLRPLSRTENWLRNRPDLLKSSQLKPRQEPTRTPSMLVLLPVKPRRKSQESFVRSRKLRSPTLLPKKLKLLPSNTLKIEM